MQLEVQKRPTLSAFQWIKRGWRVFTLNPSVFMAMAGILLLVAGLGLVIPLFNFVAFLLIPFLSAGFFQVASQVEQEKNVELGDMFEYFSRFKEYRIFFSVAAITILLNIPGSLIATEIVENAAEQIPPAMSDLVLISFLMLINFMMTAFLIQSAWVAPQSQIIELLKMSFKACWVNGLPLTVYGLVSMMILIIAFPIILIGWVIAYAVLTLMFLQAFLDIYRPVQNDINETEFDQEQSIDKNEDQNPENRLDGE